MSWRVVVVASNAKVDYKMDYLVVRTLDAINKIHMSEIAVLILESTAVSLTAYDISVILKACGIRLTSADGSIAENLLDYMTVSRDLGGIDCFVLVNLRSFLGIDELEQFYQGVLYRKIPLLLLENRLGEPIPSEEIRVIDPDLCELRLETDSEL